MNTISPRKKEYGFSLLEVIIATSLLVALSLAMAQTIASQAQQVSYLEDRLAYNDLKADLKALLEIQNGVCTSSLTGLLLLENHATSGFDIKDSSGRVLYSNDESKGTSTGHIKINSIKVQPKTSELFSSGAGPVKINFDITRKRSGGGPNSFAPIEIDQNLSLDTSNNKVSSCNGGTGNDGADCLKKFGSRYLSLGSSMQIPQDATAIEVITASSSCESSKNEDDSGDVSSTSILIPTDGSISLSGKKIQSKTRVSVSSSGTIKHGFRVFIAGKELISVPRCSTRGDRSPSLRLPSSTLSRCIQSVDHAGYESDSSGHARNKAVLVTFWK